MAKAPQAAALITPEPPAADPALATPPEAIDFDQMFADLTKPEEVVATPAKTDKPTKAKVDEPAPVETPQGEVPPVEEPPVEEPAKTATDEDILARFAELVESRRAQEPPHPQPQYQQPQPQPQPQPRELFSPEEKTTLATFEKDWPDVAKAVAIRERAFAQQLVGYVFSEVASTIRPLFGQVGTLAERTQVEEIQAREPEYAQLRDHVINWIDQQPAYLKPSYEYVRDHGTADEVADLIQRFKQANGLGQRQAAPQQRTPPVPEEQPLPPAARRAVAALAPVNSKRSVVIQGNDPADFDSAFENFAKGL